MENSFFIEKLKEANRQIDEKSFEKAGNTLNQVPEEFKRDIRFLYTSGQLEFAKGAFPKASKIFHVIITESSKKKSIPKGLQKLIESSEEKLLLALLTLKKHKPALQLSKKVLKHTSSFQVNFRSGILFNQIGDTENAIKHYQKCIELSPEEKVVHFNLGNCFQKQKKHNKAIQCFAKSIEIDKEFKEAFNNRGNCFKDLRRFQLAVNDYKSALLIDENYVAPMKNLAGIFELTKNFSESLKYIRSIVKKEPTNFDALFKLITLERQICMWKRTDKKDWELGEKILALSEKSESLAAPSPFNILNIKDDIQFQNRATRNYAKFRVKNTKRDQIKPRKLSKKDKIRIGYFSADFHTHATMHLMMRMLELHNKNHFDIYCFSFGPNLPDDPFQKRVKKASTEFLDLNGVSDSNSVELSRTKKLDIAVDLKGFTTDCRPEIFAKGVAPIQINYLGYPGSMACSFMDYIIADSIVVPSEHEKYYSEKVIRMKSSYQVNDDTRKISRKRLNKLDIGLPEDQFVFCNFNNSYKIGQIEFRLWCEILSKCPNSILWLLDTSKLAKENLSKELDKFGLDNARLYFAEKIPSEEHLKRIQNADLFLDTFNYNAHTTGSDALWAGVPILTLPGNSFPARVGASLVSAANVPELICKSKKDYVEKACKYYEDHRMLSKVKNKLGKKNKKLPLFATKKFVDELEIHYMDLLKS